jgi:hypothetical protein
MEDDPMDPRSINQGLYAMTTKCYVQVGSMMKAQMKPIKTPYNQMYFVKWHPEELTSSIEVFLDTGANTCLARRSEVEKLGLKTTKMSRPLNCETAEGHFKLKDYIQLTSRTLYRGKHRWMARFYICETLPMPWLVSDKFISHSGFGEKIGQMHRDYVHKGIPLEEPTGPEAALLDVSLPFVPNTNDVQARINYHHALHAKTPLNELEDPHYAFFHKVQSL